MALSKQEKVRENRLRQMAERQALRLTKSRRRDPLAIDYGKYMLVDEAGGKVVAGSNGTGRAEFSLDDIERYLTRTR